MRIAPKHLFRNQNYWTLQLPQLLVDVSCHFGARRGWVREAQKQHTGPALASAARGWPMSVIVRDHRRWLEL